MNFLLIGTDPVMLMDMIGSLRALWPQSVIETAISQAQARQRIASFSEISGVMIGLPPSEIFASNLPELIEQKRGRIIVPVFDLADCALDVTARGWTPLEIPFTNATFQDALINAGFVWR